MKNKRVITKTQKKRYFFILGTAAGALVIASALIWEQTRSYWSGPLGISAKTQRLQPTLISEESEMTIPLFYFILNIPKNFLNKPIPYQISYKKGPPSHFISQIEGRMDTDIQLTFEGPKTPERILERSKIQSCLTSPLSWECLSTRELVLHQYVQNPASQNPTEWDLQWFQVNDSTLSAEEQTQGFYLQAKDSTHTLDQWIFIQASGAQQLISLRRPNTPTGQSAFDLVSQSIASIRTYPDLKYGRELINRTLAEVRLEAIKNESNPALRLKQLVETQILLIAKVSVEPDSLDSFFHLAGTSTLLLKNADPAHFFWSSLAQGNLRASYLYAHDIAPLDPKTSQIQAFWLDTNITD